MGASSSMDGHHCAIFPANGANTPVEIFESDTPLIVEERCLVPDSGGPGKKRGGLGRRKVIRVPDDEYAPPGPVTIAVQAGRFRYPPEGLFGGGDGSKAQFLKNEEQADPSGLTLAAPGDRVAFYSAGGGGYGNPFERDPRDVAEDVQNGYVSIEKAREDYGVIISPDTLTADAAATAACRARG
jgi:N-methylhydantoinase B